MDDNHVNIFVSRRSDFDIIRRRLETLIGDHFVPMPEFCPPTFMTRYTRFPDIAAMLAASRLPFAADGEPDKLEGSYRDRWDQFVSQNSDFANWKEMEDRAAARWVSDQLTGTGEVLEGQNIHIDELAARSSDSAIDNDPYLPDFSIYNGDLIRARDDLIRAIQATVGLGAGEIERISPNPYLTGETPTIAELHRLFDAAARSYVLSRVANQPELREFVDAMNVGNLQTVRRLYRRVLFNKGFPLGSPPPDSAPPDEREVAIGQALSLFKARFIYGMQRIWMEPEQVADEAYLVVLYRIEIGGKILKVMAHGAARKLKSAAADIRKLPSDVGLIFDQGGIDVQATLKGLHAGAATVSDTFTFGFFFDEHKKQAWQNIGLEGSDTQQLSEFFATASREIALYALAVNSVKLARTGSKAGMVGVTTFTAIEGAEAAGWSVEVYQQFVQDNYEKALIAGAFAILAAFGFREGIDDALKSILPLANDLGKATRTAANALDEFGAQISDLNALGSGLGGLGDFGKGSKKPNVPETTATSNETGVVWTKTREGARIRQVGNYWIKEVDPDRSGVVKWWARTSLQEQVRALDRLRHLAPSHLFKNGKLIIKDVGEFKGSMWEFLKIWAAGSRKLGTPFNDIRTRNIGANGQIFDPAWHPIGRAGGWFLTSAGVAFIAWEGYVIFFESD